MTAPQIKGWCPGALRPMESGDGLVVRVRVPGGRLTAHQAQSLAALAATHGRAARNKIVAEFDTRVVVGRIRDALASVP